MRKFCDKVSFNLGYLGTLCFEMYSVIVEKRYELSSRYFVEL